MKISYLGSLLFARDIISINSLSIRQKSGWSMLYSATISDGDSDHIAASVSSVIPMEVLDPHDRLENQAKVVLSRKRAGFLIDDRCPHCFMLNFFCICKKVKEIFQSHSIRADGKFIPVSDRIHISLYMHFKEYGRSSNTGKLLSIGQPDLCTIYLYGQPEDEEALFHRLSYPQIPSLILYPTADAVPISQYRDKLFTSSSSSIAGDDSLSDSPTPSSLSPLLNLCVLDATWMQSATLEKHLPKHIPRVKIDDHLITRPSLFLNRKQSIIKTKISTIEAVMLAYRALGDAHHPDSSIDDAKDAAASGGNSDILKYQLALEHSVDAVFCQAGKPPVYGHPIQPDFSLCQQQQQQQQQQTQTVTSASTLTAANTIDSSNSGVSSSGSNSDIKQGGFTKPMVQKPTSCPFCQATSQEKGCNFRNIGVKVKPNAAKREESLLTVIQKNFFVTFPEVMDSLAEGALYRVWQCSHCLEHFPVAMTEVTPGTY